MRTRKQYVELLCCENVVNSFTKGYAYSKKRDVKHSSFKIGAKNMVTSLQITMDHITPPPPHTKYGEELSQEIEISNNYLWHRIIDSFLRIVK